VLCGWDCLVKVFIFYDSKYGNTKLCAERVAEGMRSLGVDVELGYVKDVNPEEAVSFDAFVLGAPNHMGRPSQTMKKFVNGISLLGLREKKVAVFGTYAGKQRNVDRAVKKMLKLVEEKLPDVVLLSVSLSVRVNGVSGPVVDGELPRCEAFGMQIAEELEK
jgi:flavorubredoxin